MSNLDLSSIRSSISGVQAAVNELSSQTQSINRKVDVIDGVVDQINTRLGELNTEFQKMVADQKKRASLQKAISELIRVRQEIEQKYGNHAVIRETMLGVLQATDLALVKKTTISQVSEELMLSAPKYWLAPCLVAISAWISNDRSLAERAIAEAMKRDEEKTSLAMALICRRNGRTDTCYEWLSHYFTKQSASSITEETFTYIDAYINGVFGPDEKNMCQGFVSKWINEVRGNNSNFEVSQEEKWKAYCAGFKKNTSDQFPELHASTKEFSKIDEHIGAIRSYGAIKENFKGITDAYIDQETMKSAIDTELVKLVSHYDASEVEIKREEEYLSLVRQHDGDEERAKAIMDKRELKRTQHKLDFIEQMSREITSSEATAPSKRKTAVTFLSGYINKGFEKYIAETKEKFPSSVSISIEKWNGTSKSGDEYEQLAGEFEKQMEEAKAREIQLASTVKPRVLLILSILALIAAVAAVFLVQRDTLVIPLALFLAGVVFFLSRLKAQKNINQNIERIQSEYRDRISNGKDKLKTTLGQWREALSLVRDYDSRSDHSVVA